MFRRRPSNRQAVERCRAAADFIEDDKTAFRCLIQDSCGFQHFHHESGAASREIVCSADPREEAIYYPDSSGLYGHEAAYLRQNCDEGVLAKKGGLAGHIRAGHQPKTRCTVRRKIAVVSYERLS